MLYMLDTDISSYVIKGRLPQAEDRISALEAGQISISVITRAELMYGLQRLDPAHKLHRAVRQFLDTVQVLAWKADAADVYATIRHKLASTGQAIGDMDMMIAAHSIAVGATLVTNNMRHFERIPAPLILRNWS